MPDANAIVAAINAHCETLSDHDKDGWLAFGLMTRFWKTPWEWIPTRGIESLRTSFWKLVTDLSPMKLWLERDVIVCGNEAIAILQGVVTREGSMQHVGPLVDHFTFNDAGKISMMRAFWKYA